MDKMISVKQAIEVLKSHTFSISLASGIVEHVIREEDIEKFLSEVPGLPINNSEEEFLMNDAVVELLKENKRLRNLLEQALKDIEIACSEQLGFIKISLPRHTDISIEKNDGTLYKVAEKNEWRWRYADVVEEVLKRKPARWSDTMVPFKYDEDDVDLHFGYQCSVCGKHANRTLYCGNCGSLMENGIEYEEFES